MIGLVIWEYDPTRDDNRVLGGPLDVIAASRKVRGSSTAHLHFDLPSCFLCLAPYVHPRVIFVDEGRLGPYVQTSRQSRSIFRHTPIYAAFHQSSVPNPSAAHVRLPPSSTDFDASCTAHGSSSSVTSARSEVPSCRFSIFKFSIAFYSGKSLPAGRWILRFIFTMNFVLLKAHHGAPCPNFFVARLGE